MPVADFILSCLKNHNVKNQKMIRLIEICDIRRVITTKPGMDVANKRHTK